MNNIESLKEYIKKNTFFACCLIIIIVLLGYEIMSIIKNNHEDFNIDTKYVGTNNNIKIECVDETGTKYYLSCKTSGKCLGVDVLDPNECGVGIPVLMPETKFIDCENKCAADDNLCQQTYIKCLNEKKKFLFTVATAADGKYKLSVFSDQVGVDVFLSNFLQTKNIPKLCFKSPNSMVIDSFPLSFTPNGETGTYHITYTSTDPKSDIFNVPYYVSKCDPTDSSGICTGDDGNYVRLCSNPDVTKALSFSFILPPASGIN